MKNLEKSHTRDLTAQLKASEQLEANSPKRSRWQEIIKHRAQKQQKVYKFIETEYLSIEPPLHQGRSKERNQRLPRIQ